MKSIKADVLLQEKRQMCDALTLIVLGHKLLRGAIDDNDSFLTQCFAYC